MEKRMRSIIVFAIFGAVISGYSLNHHYDTREGWCNLTAVLNCDIVNRGPYSEIAGIPVSLIGIIGYAGIALVALIALIKKDEQKELVVLLKIALVPALLFSLYLTYLEAFVLHVYCPLCLISLVIVTVSCISIFMPAARVGARPSL